MFFPFPVLFCDTVSLGPLAWTPWRSLFDQPNVRPLSYRWARLLSNSHRTTEGEHCLYCGLQNAFLRALVVRHLLKRSHGSEKREDCGFFSRSLAVNKCTKRVWPKPRRRSDHQQIRTQHESWSTNKEWRLRVLKIRFLRLRQSGKSE